MGDFKDYITYRFFVYTKSFRRNFQPKLRSVLKNKLFLHCNLEDQAHYCSMVKFKRQCIGKL